MNDPNSLGPWGFRYPALWIGYQITQGLMRLGMRCQNRYVVRVLEPLVCASHGLLMRLMPVDTVSVKRAFAWWRQGVFHE